MQNKVFITPNQIIEVSVIGSQTTESVAAMGNEIDHACKLLKDQSKPVLILDDITKIGSVPPDARKKVVALGKTLPYDKLAMLGNSGILRLAANLLFTAMGQGSKTKFFDNRQQAEQWLKS